MKTEDRALTDAARNEILAALPDALLPWFQTHRRELPWRRDREPYHVWLSEIMLQQTRVEAVKDYYERFLAALPDIPALAEADPELLTKLWEGLGYYSRVRNLQAAARQIMAEHGGVFPADFSAIRALKGVGDYTAGAIASICFEQPVPAVDGNVLRVCARLTGDPRDVGEQRTKDALRADLAAVYPAGHCGEFTQALMELGATVCLPNGAPACDACPCRALCRSAEGLWRSLPVKKPKRARRKERLTVFVLYCGDAVALRKRPERGLLAGLWELPHVPGALEAPQALEQASLWGCVPTELLREREETHIFTHVEWEMRAFYLRCRETPPEFVWADAQQRAGAYALPTAFRKLLQR